MKASLKLRLCLQGLIKTDKTIKHTLTSSGQFLLTNISRSRIEGGSLPVDQEVKTQRTAPYSLLRESLLLVSAPS